MIHGTDLTSYIPRLSQSSRDQLTLAGCTRDKGRSPTGAQADIRHNRAAVSLMGKGTGCSPTLPGFVAWLCERG